MKEPYNITLTVIPYERDVDYKNRDAFYTHHQREGCKILALEDDGCNGAICTAHKTGLIVEYPS